MEWNFDNVKFNGKDLDRVQVDGVTVWEKKKVVYYEYCRNTATTRLDTGIIANNNTRLEFKLWGNVTDSFYSMGTRDGAAGRLIFALSGSRNDQSVQVGIGTTTTKITNLTRISSGYTYSGWYQTNGDMTYSFYLKDEGTNTEYNGNNISYTQSLADNEKHIFLFSNGFNDILATLRLYYVRIYQDGVLVRDFRPAKVNGVNGLYDEVSGQLFTAPNLLVSGEIKYYDYLENDGVAYIDTGIKNIINCEFGAVAQQLELYSGFPTILGANDTNVTYKVIFGYGATSGMFYSQTGGNSGWKRFIARDLDKHSMVAKIYANSAEFTFDNTTYTASYANTNSINYSLYLFARNSYGTVTSNTKQKVYSLYIIDNGVVIRDYKPCLYNNQAGLWDSVECKFYGNANNTGTLTVGNDG